MLERLRIKRNSSKTQAGVRGGGQGKDTRLTDASRRGGSSSRSNSTGKDAEAPQDLPAGQQPSPFRLGPSDSSEGIESVAVVGAAASRRSGAVNSAATASSLPGSSYHNQQEDQPQPPLQHQVLLQRRPPRQAAQPPSPSGPPEAPLPGPAQEGAARGAPRGGGGPVDQQELLRLFLAQDAALLPPRRNPLATGGVAGSDGAHLSAGAALATAAPSSRDVRMADFDSQPQEDGSAVGGGAAGSVAPLYHDAPYGLPAGMAGGAAAGATSRMQLGLREAAAAAAGIAPAEHLSRRQPAAELPLRRGNRGEILVELAGGRIEDSLLLQLAIPRGGHAHGHGEGHPDAGLGSGADARAGVGAGGGPPPSRVLDLERPPAPATAVLNLSSRVDLNLELQLQDIYREMAISDLAAATSSPLAGHHSLLQQQQQQQQQGPLLRSGGSAPLLGGSSVAFSATDALLPLGCHARRGQHQQQPSTAALMSDSGHTFFSPQRTAMTPTASAAALLPPTSTSEETSDLLLRLSQQRLGAAQLQVPTARLPPRPHTAYSDLAAAMRMGAAGISADMNMEPIPLSLAGRMSSAPTVPQLRAELGFGLGPKGVGTGPVGAVGADPQQLLLQPPQSATGASGMAASHLHDGSRAAGGGAHRGNDMALSDPRGYGVHGGGGSASFAMDGAGNYYRGSGAGAMAAIPEAGDGSAAWCSGDEIDAALDMLMEEAGGGAVYHNSGNSASLERICFKLHNLHPNDLPRDLMGAMGSWLAAARAEVVQGAIRPGCTQLILDVYARGSDPMDEEIGEGGGDGNTGAWQAPPPQPPSSREWLPPAETSEPEVEQPKGSKGRVLGGLIPSEGELTVLEAAAQAAGAEAMRSVDASGATGPSTSASALDAADGAGGSGSSASRPCAEGAGGEGNGAHLGSYVMHGGNVRAAAAAFKKLLGPRAVQSMSVTISHEMLTISSRDMGRYVADVRGTMAGLNTPLLLSVTPLAVVAGTPCQLRVIGSHLDGPGRQPQVRCQGNHVACSVVSPPAGAHQRLRPFGSPPLMGQLMAKTLPGSHRTRAVTECMMLDLQVDEAPDAGLMMLEWEADRTAPSGCAAISDWLPLLSVPDATMAAEINRLAAGAGKDAKGGQELRGLLTDLGLVLDYVTRVNQRLLLSQSALMASEQGVDVSAEADDDDANITDIADPTAGPKPDAAPGGLRLLGNTGAGDNAGGRGAGGLPAAAEEHAYWLNRSGGGGEDQRMSFSLPDGVVSAGEQQQLQQQRPEHDSLTELMARPRMSKRHYNRVAALTPALLAFAADSGMAAVMSWLMDFMLEHMCFGDLAAVFASVEPVGGTATAPGLPLLHRAVRSGNPRTVRMLLHRAASHGLACNLAQPAGPYRITPLHLAALQPPQVGMLQACGCGDPLIADIWATVTDAAGRTPAMYLRRQMEMSARAASAPGSSAAMRSASSSVGAASTPPLQPRSSTSGSTTVYRSWGSEDPVDVTAAAAVVGGSLPEVAAETAYDTGVRRPVDAAPPPPSLTSGCISRSSSMGERMLPRAGSASEVDGDCLGRLTDSVEDFRERRALHRRGGQVADAVLAEATAMGDEAMSTGMQDVAVAVAPAPAQSQLQLQDLHSQPPMPQRRLGTAAVAVAADAFGHENGNGQVPLHMQTQVGSGVVRGSMGPSTAAPPPEDSAAAANLPAAQAAAQMAAQAAAAQACGLAPRDSALLADETKAEAFFGDSTEDWLAIRKELRAKRRQEQELRKDMVQAGKGGEGEAPAPAAAVAAKPIVSGAQIQPGSVLAAAASRDTWGALRGRLHLAAVAEGGAWAQAAMVAVAVLALLIAGLLTTTGADIGAPLGA